MNNILISEKQLSKILSFLTENEVKEISLLKAYHLITRFLLEQGFSHEATVDILIGLRLKDPYYEHLIKTLPKEEETEIAMAKLNSSL